MSDSAAKPRVRVKALSTPAVRVSNAAVFGSVDPGPAPARERSPHPFRLPTYPKGVLPGGRTELAMDEQLVQAWDFGETTHGLWAEGIGFMGYTYLAELSQRSEYRRASEVIAEEMTRKWIELKATGEEDKQDKIDKLNERLDHFQIRDVFRKVLEHDGFFGRGQIYLDYGHVDSDELRSRLVMDPMKLGRHTLRGFRVIDPTWTAPNTYESLDPTLPNFYRPDSWFIMGREVHDSRLLTIISRPLPDILKPAYNFGGLSLSQMMKPYVDNWLKTRQGVSDLIQAFTIFNLKTNLAGLLAGAGGNEENNRLTVLANTRNNRGLLVTDMQSEDLTNISAPLGTLDHLQAQAQEHICSVIAVPLVKYLGVTPSGLNASSDGEIRVFYDHLHARQEKVCKEAVRTILELIQLDEWGEVDPDLDFEFLPLWEMDEQTKAQVRQVEAQTDQLYTEVGAIDADEVRQRIASEDDSPYSGLDISKPAPGPPGASQGAMEAAFDPEGSGELIDGVPDPGFGEALLAALRPPPTGSVDRDLGSLVVDAIGRVKDQDDPVGRMILDSLRGPTGDPVAQALLDAINLPPRTRSREAPDAPEQRRRLDGFGENLMKALTAPQGKYRVPPRGLSDNTEEGS